MVKLYILNKLGEIVYNMISQINHSEASQSFQRRCKEHHTNKEWYKHFKKIYTSLEKNTCSV